MKLTRAIGQYIKMKHVMGNPFGQGTKVLHAFGSYLGDISLRSVRKRQVSASNSSGPERRLKVIF